MIDTQIHFCEDTLEDFLQVCDFSITGLIAAQRCTSPDENQYIQDLAEVYPVLKGISKPLNSNTDIASQLAENPDLVKAFRLDAATVDLLNNQQLNNQIKAIQQAHIVLELSSTQDELNHVMKFCIEHDQYFIVLNNLGNPKLENEAELFNWYKHIKQLAQLEHVYLKISGLPEALNNEALSQLIQRHINAAYQSFGPLRLLWGSNWTPNSALAYTDLKAQWQSLSQHWPQADKKQVEEINPQLLYGFCNKHTNPAFNFGQFICLCGEDLEGHEIQQKYGLFGSKAS